MVQKGKWRDFISKLLRSYQRQKRWQKVVISLAAVVVFCTTYALILPAVTAETSTLFERDETVTEAEANESIVEQATESVDLTGDPAVDVVAVAESQLGYTESTEDTVETPAGEENGYTHYGDEYGDPYGEWNAHFCAYVVEAAGVEDFPTGSTSREWAENLQEDENASFNEPGEYMPKPGDLIFLHTDSASDAEDTPDAAPEPPAETTEEDPGTDTPDAGPADTADLAPEETAGVPETAAEDTPDEINHMGIVVEVVEGNGSQPAQIVTIEGDCGDQVQYSNYVITDPGIMGYGEIPEAAEFSLSAETETGLVVTVSGESASLPYPARDITLTAAVVNDSEAEEILDQQLDKDGIVSENTVLMDICLLYDGEEIEPLGPVTLTFVDAEQEKAAASVYHIDTEEGTATDLEAVTENGDISVDTDHFSVYALAFDTSTTKNVNATYTVVWDSVNKQFSSVVFTAKSTAGNMYFALQSYSGSAWIPVTSWSAQVNKGTAYELDGTSSVNNTALGKDARFRVAVNTSPTNTKETNMGYTEPVTAMELLEKVKPGFSKWLDSAYESFKAETDPALADITTLAQLYNAFAIYESQPVLTISDGLQYIGGTPHVILSAATDADEENLSYLWEYYDTESGTWKTLTLDTTSRIDVTDLTALNGGAEVRCSLYNAYTRLTISPSIKVDNADLDEYYTRAIKEINESLNLSAYRVGTVNGKYSTVDLSINGERFTKYFYYDNVARDEDIPFCDAESYANYLAETFLSVKAESGKDAAVLEVRDIWFRHLFDLYDPTYDMGTAKNYTYYPGPIPTSYTGGNLTDKLLEIGNSTYGDKLHEWLKDDTSASFHTTENTSFVTTGKGTDGYYVNPDVIPLNYDYLEQGCDYSHFVTGMDKSTTAAAPGDANTGREYNVKLTADAQAKVTAPLALLITIQTSWQMFDMEHANAVVNDPEIPYTTIAVGAAQHNTEMANLYDIKQALLRFVDYMDAHYPGNNLVVGINEVQHAGSFNLLNGTTDYSITNAKGQQESGSAPCYVTNDSEVLRNALYLWNSFGNCEHVHYETDAMKSALTNLEKDLSTFQDMIGREIQYDEIEKCAVIIGGGTENSNSTNGYGCALPWSTYKSDGIDAVYGIRTNVGTVLNKDNCLSWLDYSGNNTGDPYTLAAGGTNFTEKYIAPSEDDVFNALVAIAEQEIVKKGINLEATDKYVEHVTVNDTISDEFVLDLTKPVVATVLAKDGSTECVAQIDAVNGSVVITNVLTGATQTLTGADVGRTVAVDPVTGDRTTIITFRIDQNDQKLTIVEHPESSRTTDVTYDFGKVYNTKKCVLDFGIVAREDYLGSNNVYSNVGKPDLSYRHTVLETDGTPTGKIENYGLNCFKTPQVNVPIRYDTVDGDTVKVLVGTEVDLKDLSAAIVADAEDRVDNYDQINGVLSYQWVIPDPAGGGTPTVVDAGSVTVTNGSIGSASFPDRSYPFTPTAAGTYTPVLKVTFTPTEVDQSSRNFCDADTKVAVNYLTKPNTVTVIAVDGSADASFYIQKVWASGTPPADVPEVSFKLNDGAGSYVQEDGEDKIYTLNAANNWKLYVSGLPAARVSGGVTEILSYSAEEVPVPGYEVSYSRTTQTDISYAGRADVSFKPSKGQNVRKLEITYTYNGETGIFVREFTADTAVSNKNYSTYTIDGLALDSANRPYTLTINSVAAYDKDGNTKDLGTVTIENTAPTPVVYESGSVTREVLVITNSSAQKEITVCKTDSSGTVLSGAIFSLYGEDYGTGGEPLYTGLTSGADGMLSDMPVFLNYGTYYLVETSAPGGYRLLSEPVVITVAADGVTAQNTGYSNPVALQDNVYVISVQNSSGAQLPNSGGPGTAPFVILGMLFICLPVIYGWNRRNNGERRYTR